MHLFASVVTCGLIAIATAQEPAQHPERNDHKPNPTRDAAVAAENQAWQRFQQRHPGSTWISRWHLATGTPHTIYGTGLQLEGWFENSLDHAREHAGRLLRDEAELLGLGVSEFREEIGARMGRTWCFVYDQYFRGLPVIGGRADVRVHMTGAVSMFGSTAFPIPANFGTVPTLDELNATRLAWLALDMPRSDVPQPAKVPAPRLVIWGDIDAMQLAPVHLAWEVAISNVDANGFGPIGRYYIDAQNGRVLHYTNDKHECGSPSCTHSHHGKHLQPKVGAPFAPVVVTVMGWTRTGTSAVSPVVNIPLAGVEVTVPGVTGVQVTDANGQFTVDVALPTTANIVLNGIHNATVGGAQAPTVSVALDPAIGTATAQFWTAAATSEQAAHTNTYYWVYRVNEFCRTVLGNSTQLNAANNVVPTVNITSTCNAYYTGNTINFYATGGNCNNTAFSTVVAHEWGHGIDDRYGGISQTNGLSEGWGDINAMYLVDNAIVGEFFTTSGGYIRTGNNTRQYPTGSGVHAQGESWMGFAWKLRNRLKVTQGTQNGIAISNDIVISSLAADATNQADAVTQVFVADDDDANLLNGVPHYDELVYACGLHSLPYPERQFGILTHTPLTSTQVQMTPRMVAATITPTYGTFSNHTLFYNDGQNRSRPLLPTGSPNQFRALLPGKAAPATITYHFEATHSSGPTARFPATGEFSYFVGAENVFFSETFETGAPGWAHGMVATQDDWQIGASTGRTGTGWTDPTGGYQSSNCAGNDLGIGNFNGAYQNNVNNWLRSPTINCSGQTGVRLRFRRWLTVEEGIYDQARIMVNNAQVWVNQSSGNHIDTGWTLVDLPIPAADNNPSVTIEWRLQTDAGLVFGGWAIDNVELVANSSVAPLAATLQLLPEQATENSSVSIVVQTQGVQPFWLAIGDTPGPTNVPNVPPVLVGGNYVLLIGTTSGTGLFIGNVTAPPGMPAAGGLYYSQVVTLNSSSQFVVSNQFLNLIHP